MPPIHTSSPRVCRRIASVSMVWVLPTPGAYPRKSLNLPVFFAGEHSSSHCSGVLGIAIIVVEIVKGYKVGIETATLGCSRERVFALARDFVPTLTLESFFV